MCRWRPETDFFVVREPFSGNRKILHFQKSTQAQLGPDFQIPGLKSGVGAMFHFPEFLQLPGAKMIFEAAPGWPAKMVAASAPRGLPSTCAGGQDDGS